MLTDWDTINYNSMLRFDNLVVVQPSDALILGKINDVDCVLLSR